MSSSILQALDRIEREIKMIRLQYECMIKTEADNSGPDLSFDTREWLYDAGLSVRSLNILRREDRFRTADDICNMPDRELLKVKYLGPETLREIRTAFPRKVEEPEQ